MRFPGATHLVVHCRSQEEAEKIREAIERRLLDCKLEAHPEKTKIVYCRDGNRKGTYERKEFDFLGFTFRPRMARNKYGAYFLSFGPAISRKAKKAIKAEIRSWKLYRRVSQEIEDVARISNLKLRGWEAYYGKFRRSELYEVYHMVQLILVKWVRNKYKRVKRSWRGAASLLRKIAKSRPDVFDHWKRGWYTNG